MLILSLATLTWPLSGTWTWMWLFIVALILHFLIWGALLLGVILDKSQLVLASAFGLIIAIMLEVVTLIVLVTASAYAPAYLAGHIVGILIRLGLDIYFGIVIFSYYRTMKHGRSSIF